MSLILEYLPVWAIVLLLLSLFWTASFIGNRMRERMRVASEATYASSAAVSLLVLLISFTFSLALNRYDNRRDLGVEEAAAIYSTWERVQLLPPDKSTEMAGILRAYADERLLYFKFGIDKDDQMRADQSADDLMAKMWVLLRDEVATSQQPLVTRMLMDNLTRIDDAAWRREAMARARIPFFVIDLLVIFSLLTAASMGLSGPQGRRVHPAHTIFFLLNASAIMLVIDLDRPREGMIQISQRPMLELIEIMKDDIVLWSKTSSSKM